MIRSRLRILSNLCVLVLIGVMFLSIIYPACSSAMLAKGGSVDAGPALSTSSKEQSDVVQTPMSDTHDGKDSLQPSITEHEVSSSDLEILQQKIGVSVEGTNYNLIIRGHGTGLRPPTKEEWTGIAKNAYVVDEVLVDQTVPLPSSLDLTTEPWFPPIGNQGSQPSCTVWAVGYYMKTCQEAKEHVWDLSGALWEGGHPSVGYQNWIISPAFIYHLTNGGEAVGTSSWTAINLICSIGASSWAKMPYNLSDYTSWPSESAWREAPLYRGNDSGWQYMWVDNDAGLTNLKNWIASGNLAMIGVDAGQYTSLTSNDVWTLDNYVISSINHANTIVGYDNNIAYIEGGQTRYGAFKVANSWGVGGWEHVPDGCYWISYEAMKQRVGGCEFYYDRIGYAPELVASFQILYHQKRGECNITVSVENQAKWFNEYIYGGDQPFCSNEILLDITEFKESIQDISSKTFLLSVYDGGSSTTGVVTDFAIESIQSLDTPLSTLDGDTVWASLTLPSSGANSRTVYCEHAYSLMKWGSWFSVADPQSWSGLVMMAPDFSSNGGWLSGPYFKTEWDGESMLGKPYVATFRLKASSNVAVGGVALVAIGYDGGALQLMYIRGSDFVSSNTWQDFKMTFTVPSSLFLGLFFVMVNLNNGVTNLYVDYVSASRGWAASTVYCEGAYNKPQSGSSWSEASDFSSSSGIVMKASASSSNGGCLFGPYITSDWNRYSMLGKLYTATFRLKVSSNTPHSNVVCIDVACNGGTVIRRLYIKASDFLSSNAWQDFSLAFIVPNSLTYGLEFRILNANSGVTDVYVDRIAVDGPLDNSVMYFENACSKQRFGNSWSGVGDSSSYTGSVMMASSTSANFGCLYGPYITEGLDGASILGKPYIATFRLKVSSNASYDPVASIDVTYNAGTVLHSELIRAGDFMSSNAWQDFTLTFVTPSFVTAGLEFRVTTLNHGVTDLYVDYIEVTKAWNATTTFMESGANKLQFGDSWLKMSDASSFSGVVMRASDSASNGGVLYGPYITEDLNGASMLGNSYVADFRLKVTSNQSASNVAYIDVCCNYGAVIGSTLIKAADFESSNTWQDFRLFFTVPDSVSGGLEVRIESLNNGIADLLIDTIAVKPTLTAIALVWEQNPRDLDSHLTARLDDNTTFHVYYGSRGDIANPPFAKLETDAVNGYGPEVIFISRLRQGTYRYSVRHYAGEGTIATSGAEVDLVIPGVGTYRFTPFAGQPSGTDIWRVFDIVVDSPGHVAAVNPINDYVTGSDESNLLFP